MRKIGSVRAAAVAGAAASALLSLAIPAGAYVEANEAATPDYVRLFKDDTSQNPNSQYWNMPIRLIDYRLVSGMNDSVTEFRNESDVKICFYKHIDFRGLVASASPGTWRRLTNTSRNDVISSHQPC